ncbi:hypothetical protein QQF73_00530 [Marinobacter sp. M216]|uniref:Uracil-DNA glycosylase-like domain-containing protein n=1 Tax=Marinobacter albus TaxID=3030833 RepID=A0ABT7H6X6_9GAMM|nr:hypothetical protein [Marinobacter sp. M216]MDK9556089.1 hypothetical protein [Marinobacter sp. M216]
MGKIQNLKKEELLSLYNTNFEALFSATENHHSRTHGPFLISPNSDYWSAPVRLAFIGQETRAWVSSDRIESQISGYERFNLGEHYPATPFFNIMRKLEHRITAKNYASAYLNLNRYSEKKKRPCKALAARLSEIDWILAEELEILDPHVIIALTGPSYDHRLSKLFTSEQRPIGNFKKKQLCEFANHRFDGRVIRTYHPNYLRLSKLENPVIEAIGNHLEQ